MAHSIERADIDRVFARFKELTGDSKATLQRSGAFYRLLSDYWTPGEWYGKIPTYEALHAFNVGFVAGRTRTLLHEGT